MAVIWVLEKPRPASENLPDLLQGDFAVRAFASLRNFLRLAPLSRQLPDLLLVRAEDFKGELDNLDRIASLHWPATARVYLGGSFEGQGGDERLWLLDEENWMQLSFLVQQILRNGKVSSSAYLQWEEISIDPEVQSIRLKADGPWVKVAPKELQLLRAFLKHPEHCLSHEDLNQEVWRGVKVSNSSVASHISRLRRYLEDSCYEIRSVYGGGYQLLKSHTP